MKDYDIVILTHLPAFYKINLYNELSQVRSIFVVFISSGSTQRTSDFTEEEIKFDFQIISQGSFEERNILRSCYEVFRLLKSINYRKVIVNGWDLSEFWLAIWLKKGIKSLALESNVFQSTFSGYKGLIKKLFLYTIDIVHPSGIPHQQLLVKLAYKGKTASTGGVGIPKRIALRAKIDLPVHKCLIIARLVEEKNLFMAIQAFNELPNFELTIVGDGPLLKELKSLACERITFAGHIPNNMVRQLYFDHHLFILPSSNEAWGLVIEEALQSGMPVIVSNKVGCAIDLVTTLETGLVYDCQSIEGLKNCILQLSDPVTYQLATGRVSAVDFDTRYCNMVEAYAVI